MNVDTRPRHKAQGFVQPSTSQPFVAQSSDLADIPARGLVVGVKGQPTDSTSALVYEFRGTGRLGSYVRYFSVAGAQTVLLDLTTFDNWALKLLAAGDTTIPPNVDLAWASTLAEAPDPARRETARLAGTYAANVVVPVPPGAVRCWSANNSNVNVIWYTFTTTGTPIALPNTLQPAADVLPKGTNFAPGAAVNLVWEIVL